VTTAIERHRQIERNTAGVLPPNPLAQRRECLAHRNRIEADHSQLKHRLRPMRGLRTDRTAAVVIAGHAFMQNLRRGHYELGLDIPRRPCGSPPPSPNSPKPLD